MTWDSLTRRSALALAGAGFLSSSTSFAGRRTQDEHDPLSWGVWGKGWDETGRPYSRLPLEAKGVVRDAVWNLGQDSAGLSIAFETDSTAIDVEVELLTNRLAMPHMPASGASGLDLYGERAPGAWSWIQCTRPSAQKHTLSVKGLTPGKRAYRVYLPLYNGVESLRVRVAPGAHFRGLAPTRPDLVYYGTSIAQGACASRPGMALPSILGRKLGAHVVNLGFSGNGKMEPEVATLLAELDPQVFVIDCLPNMHAPLVTERAAPLVRTLRKARSKTPILLVEDRRFANTDWFPSSKQHHDANHAALRAAYDELVGEGVQHLTYVADAPFLGEDGEGTVDASHPTDLGAMRWAQVMAPTITPLLER